MRIVTSRLWASGEAERKSLISVHDFDLNDQEALSEFRQINPTLENAIAHDIANQGSAVAEVLDQNRGGADAQDACRLLLVSSLANVPNAVVGLKLPQDSNNTIRKNCRQLRKVLTTEHSRLPAPTAEATKIFALTTKLGKHG